MRRTALLTLVLALLIAPAATARTVDVPKLFATQIQRSHTQTPVPILLPTTMRADFRRFHPEGRARPNAWRFDVGAVKGCGGAGACFIAEFRGVHGRSPTAPRTLRLTRGRTGYFRPSKCGASCSPPLIQWRERRTLYTIEAKVGRHELVRMANSAIRNGPR
jgi:hypothetical protein